MVIQVKAWGEKEAQELRTALHAMTGAYKTALERIKLLEDALEQREAMDAAAEVRTQAYCSQHFSRSNDPLLRTCCLQRSGEHQLVLSLRALFDACLMYGLVKLKSR